MLPLTTPRSISALGVGNGWGNPVAILLIIPLLRFLGVGVRDSQRFIIEPALRLDGILVDNFIRSVFVPIARLYRRLDYKELPRCDWQVPWLRWGQGSA